MLATFRRFITRFCFIFLVIGSFLLVPARAQAQAVTSPWTGVCVSHETFKLADGTTDSADVATVQGIQCILANILSIAVTGIGLAGFVMFIVGAFNYLISGGNSKGIESARNTFTYAIVGLVVALSAVIILRLIASFTGVNQILQFKIPNSNCGLNGLVC